MKFKSKISYLGEKISILPWQMAEQLSVEVNVKNVTQYTHSSTQQYTAGQAPLFDLDNFVKSFYPLPWFLFLIFWGNEALTVTYSLNW